MLQRRVELPPNVRAPRPSVVYVQPNDFGIMKATKWGLDSNNFDEYVQITLAAMGRQVSSNTLINIHLDNKLRIHGAN